MSAEEYRALVRELARANADRDAVAHDVEQSYVDGVRSASAEVCTAAADLAAEAERARQAAGAIAGTDAEAAGAWRGLGALLGGRAAARLGPPPLPEMSIVEDDPTVPLRRAVAMLAAARRRRRQVGTGWLWCCPPAGALAAATVAVLARLAARLAGDALPVRVLAMVLLFAAPFAAVPGVLAYCRHRALVRYATAAGTLAALGGMVACCALAVALH